MLAQIRRTKEILSANTAAPVSVEELHDGIDYQVRTCDGLWRPLQRDMRVDPYARGHVLACTQCVCMCVCVLAPNVWRLIQGRKVHRAVRGKKPYSC